MIKELEIFKAIGEETRLRIMRVLLKADTDLCACEIIDVLGKPQYTISKSLGVLVTAGLLAERREGRMMFYSLRNNAFNETVFNSIRQISCNSNEAFKSDYNRLARRLSRRVDGLCLEGCKR